MNMISHADTVTSPSSSITVDDPEITRYASAGYHTTLSPNLTTINGRITAISSGLQSVTQSILFPCARKDNYT